MNVLHETATLVLVQSGKSLEIHLKQATHGVLVGSPKDTLSGIRCMERLENYPANLKRFCRAL